MEKRHRRKFTDEFKAKAVQLVQSSNKTVAEVARDLDLTPSSLGAWVKQAEIDAGRGPVGALTSEEREELSRLRKENRVLKEEREILRKAAAHSIRHCNTAGNSSARRSEAQNFPWPTIQSKSDQIEIKLTEC
jgi:transposase